MKTLDTFDSRLMNERGGKSMIELEKLSIAVVADAAASNRIAPHLLACGVSPAYLKVVDPGHWTDAIHARPALCFWGLSSADKQAHVGPDPRRWPACLGSCLNVWIDDLASPADDPLSLGWHEFSSDMIRGKLLRLMKEAQSRLHATLHEQWYRLAVAEADVGLWWWDRTLNFVYLSEHFQRMLGLTAEQLPGSVDHWLSLVHPADRDELRAVVEAQFEEHRGRFQHECRLLQSDGQHRWYALSGQLGQSEFERNRIFGAAIDIHAKKEADRQLARANELARSAILAKNEFLTNMSHNLRTPLTAVTGFADLLTDSSQAPSTMEAIQSIRRNSQHLLRLLDDVLELSGMESTRPSMILTETSVPALLQDVVALHQPLAATARIDLHWNVANGVPPRVLIDAARTRQILGRLLDNAVKFTPQGEVGLEARFLAAPQPTLELSVRDSGVGIPAERLDQIFEPFTQADNSLTRVHNGTGLGLSICRKLAAVLGGTLDVHSSVGEGSTFVVRLPVEVPAEPPTDSAVAEPAAVLPDLSGYRVLLVEDGVDNQRLISAFLRKAGADVVLAVDGQKGVDWIVAARGNLEFAGHDCDPHLDLILMDMQMPVMDGYCATRTLRGMGFGKPIIALTAHALSGDRQLCLDAGCDDYFTKPIDRLSLLALVKRYAELSRQRTHSCRWDLTLAP